MYLLVHLVPALLFRRKSFVKNPVKEISRLLIGWLKSMAFISWFAYVAKIGLCAVCKNGVIERKKYIALMAISALGIFIEPAGRAAEISMYALPKYFESIPVFLAKQRLLPSVPMGFNLITGLAIAIAASCYFTDEGCVKPQIKFILSLIVGKSVEPAKDIETSTNLKLTKE